MKLSCIGILSLAVRCRKCHGCVETQLCWNRSRENELSAWRFGPDNIHTFRNCSKGLHHQIGVRRGTKIGISASKTIYQPFPAGQKTTGPKRSVLHPTLRRQLCSGTQPSDYDDTLTPTPQFHPPITHIPTFHCVVLILPCNIRGIRTPAKSTRGQYLLMSTVVTIAISPLFQVVMFSYHHW